MNYLTIRRFKEEDAITLSKLICRNFMEVNIKDYSYEDMNKLSKSYNEEKILNIASYANIYVACINKVIIGCGAISTYWGKEDESILLTIFVLPEFHGTGVGSQIIKTLEKDEIFIKSKRTEIPSSITAFEFYRKFGYKYKNGVKELDDEGHYRLEKFS